MQVMAQTKGHPARSLFMGRARITLTTKDSLVRTSMRLDVERDAPMEADHIMGDMERPRSAKLAFIHVLRQLGGAEARPAATLALVYLNNLSALSTVCNTPHINGRPTNAQASISFTV
jgi:hypothetical protein